MSELLPCPFCGLLPIAYHTDGIGWTVNCQNGDCNVCTPPCDSLETVTAIWNRRRADSQVVPSVAEALDTFLDSVKIHGVKDRVNMTCDPKAWEHLQEAVGLAALRAQEGVEK